MSSVPEILRALTKLNGTDISINTQVAEMIGYPADVAMPDFTGDMTTVSDALRMYVGNIKQLKMDAFARDDGSYCYGYLTTHAGESVQAEGRSETAVRCALLVKMMHHRQPVIIKGEGHQSKGGGFAALIINGIKFTPRQVALGVGVITE